MSGPSRRRGPLVAALVLGIGLALAPVAFRMFDRAPKGGDMIDGFAPYMTDSKITAFERDLAQIGDAHAEVGALRGRAGAQAIDAHPAVVTFEGAWPPLLEDMSSMLDTMRENIGNYDGVAALPPFPLFPFFFVIPGLLVAGVAGAALRSSAPTVPRAHRVALLVLGAGLIAAPAVFQMFARAPGGADMITDFEPFMTDTKVTQIQGYFLTIGVAEGELRNEVIPSLTASGAVASAELPALANFATRWPTISADMAPMIGAMADNVDNFEAVRALPPFWLFPWFFVVPGLLLIGLALATRPRGGDDVALAGDRELQLEGVSS